MNSIEYFKERFDQLQLEDKDSGLDSIRHHGFDDFSKLGIPTSKHEEWKYTRIGGLFNKEYQFPTSSIPATVGAEEIEAVRLPGHKEANELVFINGIFFKNKDSN